MNQADLLRAIHDDPEDAAAYLVYADSLLQRGDPRGELIQLQLRLESLAADAPERELLAAREAELIEAFSAAWTRPGVEYRFRRGFLDSLQLSAASFRARAATAAAAGDLDHLRVLDLRWRSSGEPPFTDADLAALLELPSLRRLEHLEIAGQKLGAAAGVALARADLPRLHSLALDDNVSVDAAIIAFVEAAPDLPALEELSLRTNNLTDDAVIALAGWPHLARIHSLDLSSTDVDGPGCNDLRDPGAIALVTSPYLRQLVNLDLGDNLRITSETARALAASPHPTSLLSLGLGFTAFDDDGASALASSPSLAQLRALSLAFTNLGDAGLASLLRMPCLEFLRVSGTKLTVDGVRALLDAPAHFTEVRANFQNLDLPDPLLDALHERYGPDVVSF